MKDMMEIFITFMKIGSLTFGGGYTILPLLQKDISDRHKWATYEEIIDYYAISQCLPGMIAVNTSMLIGYKRKGFLGMAAAALGMVIPSLVIILVIAASISNFIDVPAVKYAFNGIRSAVLVLVISATIEMWKSGVVDKSCIAIFCASLLAFSFIDISPIIPVIAGAVCGIIIKERKGLAR